MPASFNVWHYCCSSQREVQREIEDVWTRKVLNIGFYAASKKFHLQTDPFPKTLLAILCRSWPYLHFRIAFSGLPISFRYTPSSGVFAEYLYEILLDRLLFNKMHSIIYLFIYSLKRVYRFSYFENYPWLKKIPLHVFIRIKK